MARCSAPTGSPPRRQTWLRTRGGVSAGHALPTVRPAVIALAPGDVVVLASDGVNPELRDRLQLAGRPEEIAQRILKHSWTRVDDAVTLVVRFLGSLA